MLRGDLALNPQALSGMSRRKASAGRRRAHHGPDGSSGVGRGPRSRQQHRPGDDRLIAAVSEHVDRHIGPIRNVFHLSWIPSPVHVDVHHVPADGERRFHALVTSGMSERAMHRPAGAHDDRYAELVMLLPESWPFSEDWRELEPVHDDPAGPKIP